MGKVYADDEVTADTAPAGKTYADDEVTVETAPGRNGAYPEDKTPSDVITAPSPKPMFDPTGKVAATQREIRAGKPGEPLSEAEARVNATAQRNNPVANDWIAQEIIKDTATAPLLALAGAKVLGGAVARSAARGTGAIKQALVNAGESIANHGGHGLAEKVISKVVPGASHAIAAARAAKGVGSAGAIAADEGLGAIGRGLGVGGQVARQEASNAVSGRLAAIKDAGEEAAIRRRLQPLKSTAPAPAPVEDLPVNKLHESPSPFDTIGDDAPSTELPTEAGIPVVAKRPALAPLESTAPELSPRQHDILAKVEERYGAASAKQVQQVLEKQAEKQASPKMVEYRARLKTAEEAKFAKQLGMPLAKYRELLAKRAVKLGAE